MSKSKTVYIGKVFNRSSAPEDPRKVLSLDKSVQREDGTWRNIRATTILYEDGSQVNLGEHLVLKENAGKGSQTHNIYFLVFNDDPHTQVSDEDIPF